MRKHALPVLAIAALALAGCSQGDDSSDSSSSSSPSASSSSSSASPSSSSPSASPTETPSDSPSTAPSDAPSEESEPSAGPSQQPADDPAQAEGQSPQLTQYLQNGGGCISDVWNDSAAPYSESLHNELVQYCSANQLGDWAGGVDPMNPENYGSPEDQAQSSQAEDKAEQCKALDPATASSGARQYCYMEYGISVE